MRGLILSVMAGMVVMWGRCGGKVLRHDGDGLGTDQQHLDRKDQRRSKPEGSAEVLPAVQGPDHRMHRPPFLAG
jgi:hypothetical protein